MRLVLLVTFFASAQCLHADQASNALEGAAATWLKIPSSVRSEGMAQATAAQDGLDNLDVNPASLSGISNQEAVIGHNAWVQGTSLESAAYGLRIGSGTVLGLSLSYFNFGSVPAYQVDSSNHLVANGGFSPYGDSVGLAASQSLLGSLDLGLDLRYVGESLDGSSSTSGFTGDLGARWSMGDWKLGAALLNLAGQIDGANLPASLLAGLGWSQALGADSMTLEADLQAPFADASGSNASLGGEYWWSGRFAARLGYKLANSDGQGGGSGITAGLGARLGMAELNYAFNSVGDLGNSNQLQLLLRFGGADGLSGK